MTSSPSARWLSAPLLLLLLPLPAACGQEAHDLSMVLGGSHEISVDCSSLLVLCEDIEPELASGAGVVEVERLFGVAVQRFVLRAAQPGDAMIHFVNEQGRRRASYQIEVLRPDRVELRRRAQPDVSLAPRHFVIEGTVRLVAGGRAGLEVHYFSGSRPLIGFGALLASSTGVTAQPQPGDSLILSAGSEATTGEVVLSVGGEELATLPVEVVPTSELAGVRLEQAELRVDTLQPALRAYEDGEALVATAIDHDGEPVLGASFAFLLDDEELAAADPERSLDVLLYKPRLFTPRTVRARFLDLEETREISLDPESVRVATTVPEPRPASCAGAAVDGGWLASLLALLALLLRPSRPQRAQRKPRPEPPTSGL